LREKSSFKKVLDNAIIVLTGNMGANIFGLLSIAIFTHALGAEIFGYYVLFLTYIGIIDRIFNFQTWQAFIKYATDFQIRGEEYNLMMLLKYSFLIDFFSLSVAFLVAFIFVDFFMNFFAIPIEYTNLAIMMALSILFKVFEISTGIFRLFDEFKIQSKILIYVAVLKLMIFGLIALIQPTFANFIYATVFVQFVALVMKLFYSKQILNQNGFKIKDISREVINYKLIKELKIFSFIVYNNFDVAVRMVSRQLDIVILGKLYGAEVVGIYRIAKEVANIIAKLTDPIYQAIYPEFAKLLSSNKKLEAKKTAKKISLYAGIAGFGFYLLFALLGEFSINLAFGDEFKGAYNIVLVYFIAIFIAIISLPLVPALHAKGLAKEAFWNQLFATIGYVIVLYPLTIYFSATGTAIAYIVFYLIWLSLALKTINNNKVFT
jgi:O-antigen/teichoic acid export membrane protein